MKNVDNCPRCGAIFVKALRPICHQCFQEQEENYEKVSKFLRRKQNRQATMREVHEKTGVELQQIQDFVRDGRLLMSQFPNLTYPCESCGAQIQEGRLCKNCTDGITSDLNKLEQAKEFEKRRKILEEEARRQAVTYYHSHDEGKQ